MGNIGVYCASREGIDKVYSKVAHQTGTLISQAGHTLVYGGYELGLMGIVAKSAMVNGGKVIGITLKSLDHLPVLATEIIPASNLSERKTIIREKSQALITLSGGWGTFGELGDTLDTRTLNEHQKPLCLINTNHYYDELIAHFKKIVSHEFASPPNGMYKVFQTPGRAMEYLKPFLNI